MRAAGTRPVARVDHPLVDEDAVRGGRPDMLARDDEDVGDEPGHRALAVRPRDGHDRDAPVGVAEPLGRGRARGVRCARSSARGGAPARPSGGAVRDGETSRSASACAASVRVSARSAPVHGKVTIQWPGSDERWTAIPPRALRRGRRAAGGPRRRWPRPRPAARGRARSRPGGRARDGPDRAGRTRSAAGRWRPRA